MSHYPDPRRFAHMFEFDRNGPPWCGTREHQEAIIAAIKAHLVFDNPLDRVLRALDAKTYTSFTLIGFNVDPRIVHGFFERTWPNYAQILFPSWDAATDGSVNPEYLGEFMLHEIGHLFGYHYNPIDTSEDNAEEFRWWVANGQPTEGTGWGVGVWHRINQHLDVPDPR